MLDFTSKLEVFAKEQVVKIGIVVGSTAGDTNEAVYVELSLKGRP